MLCTVETIQLPLRTQTPGPGHNTIAAGVRAWLIHASGTSLVTITVATLEATVTVNIQAILGIKLVCRLSQEGTNGIRPTLTRSSSACCKT